MKTFKFQQIKSYFVEQIRSGRLKPGERIPSEKTLAAEWGVSPLTAGKAFAQLERESYLVRRVGDGSYVNNEQALPKTAISNGAGGNYIAMLINNMAYGLVPHLMHLIERHFSQLGYHSLIKNLEHSFEGALVAIRSLEGLNLRGVIYTPIYSDLYETENLDIYRNILQRTKAVVMVGSHLRRADCNHVASDNLGGACLGVKHMIERGRRRIALVWNDRDSATYDRIEGYKKALEEAGIAFNEDYIVRSHYQMPSDSADNPCEAAMRALMALPQRPDGVFALDDYLALFIEHYCDEYGIAVPRDLAIVGYDDFLVTRLTSVKQDIEQIADRTVDLLLALMNGREPQEKHVIVPTTLAVREST
ncbi:MAG: GntR family transcriptional regulator [bacterium]|nr:GntR family transcriptional regulator [Candidatus Sumerlaeota bacterium]